MKSQKTKVCNTCKENKELDEFYRLSKSPDGRQYTCKLCQDGQNIDYKARNPDKVKRNRRAVLLKGYGINTEIYDQMLADQNGVCKICKRPEVSHWRTDKLFVDHCHETGKVRGLLCHHCNYAIGGFKDNVELMKEAIKYLEDSK